MTPTPTEDDYETPRRYFPFGNYFIPLMERQTVVEWELMGIQVEENGKMWFVINGTTTGESPNINQAEWITITRSFAQTWDGHRQGEIEGDAPSRLRVVELDNDLVEGATTTFVLEEEDVQAYVNGSIDGGEFDSRWFETIRATTEEEDEMAAYIARGTNNRTIAPDD